MKGKGAHDQTMEREREKKDIEKNQDFAKIFSILNVEPVQTLQFLCKIVLTKFW